MYERSAVILEKYFAEKFYYRDRSNIKSNYENYRMLIEVLEKYQEVSEEEDKIINECEDIADRIKQIQKNQSSLYRKTLKLHEDRSLIFENIDEDAEDLERQLEKIENEIDRNNEQMRPTDQDFIEALGSFNEKSKIRSEYGRKRRNIEKDYRDTLDETINNINQIDSDQISDIKKTIMADDSASNEQLKKLMKKNGEKEKIPFDLDVIDNAIIFAQIIYKQEARILVDVYEKTNNLINETNNNVVKIKRYKKLAKDSKNKLSFLNMQKEYLAQFLDNERLSVSLGKQEHSKLMKEACDDFRKDTKQITNLNNILLKEITNKATQKMYNELYSAEYLNNLQKQGNEFENKLSELHLAGKILNPIYWRIESIEKIYDTFDEIVTQEYGRDLSKFKIQEEEVSEEKDIMAYYDSLEADEDEENEDEAINEEEKPNLTFEDEEEKDNRIKIISFDDEDDDEYEDEDEDFFDEEVEEIKINKPNKKEVKNEDADDEEVEEDLEDEKEIDEFDEDEDDDDYDDEEYEDIDIILQNRKKVLGKHAEKKKKNTKKKGLFGFGIK